MIIEMPNDNSIVKWKNDDKDEWKYAEISDLIKAYERPQGDLISRAALLKRVDEERKYLIARGQTGAEHILVHNFRDLIDNAPTVDAYTEERVKELVELNKKLSEERPQGEWILNKDENPECPFCHHSFTYWGNFCGNCGAQMGGKK